MMEVINPRNDMIILNATMVSRFLNMYNYSKRTRIVVFNVYCMLLNSLLNGATNFPNVRNPTRAWDKVRPFHVFRVNRVLNRSKEISNGIQGLNIA